MTLAKLKRTRNQANGVPQSCPSRLFACVVEGERFQRARKRVRDALIEDGVAVEIEKLVDGLLGPVAAA